MLIDDGIPTKEDLAKVFPSEERLKKGAVAILECFQEIPCNPCVNACKRGSITIPGDINHLPVLDAQICDGCGGCIPLCPGLAIFIVDITWSEDRALVKLPFENLPVPKSGQYAAGLNRAGQEVGWFEIIKVVPGGKTNLTYTITLAVPQDLAMEVRSIRAGGYRDGDQQGR
ncbi:MAG: 4Fe-4S ferredoxin [Oscillospiraceae bacterium]|nr:4Fe-4S ferredoxin [Oscillospiraceae bacterium]